MYIKNELLKQGEMFMKSMRRNITALLATTLLVSLTTFSAKALEINNEMFSGTANSTVTSGFSVRASERNCATQAGAGYNTASGEHVLNATGLGAAALDAYGSGATATQLLTGGDKNYQYSNSCATRRTDGYGNTSTDPLDLGSQNTDDGDLNYDDGEIIDATQKVFTEIDGTMSNGIGITLSFIANYNPVDDLSGTNFMPLTTAAKDDLESDFTLLNAYVTSGFEVDGLGYVDVTAGRYVTSWGEATFIPVGANGLVTNAVDLSALRAPGASIRDALLPTEQITFNSSLGDNLGLEVYYQFSNDSIELDPKGSFFGSELAGAGGDRILASGGYANEAQGPAYCTWTDQVRDGNACDADAKARHLATATRENYDTEAILQNAFRGATAIDWATWTATGAGGDHGRLVNPAGLLVEDTLAAFVTTGADIANLNSIYTNNVRDAMYDNAASVELYVNEQKFVDSKDDGQFGIRLNTYLEDVGTGLDLNAYYMNYHSKVPYIQIVGEGGVLAGDIMGAYNYALADFGGGVLDDGNDAAGFTDLAGGASASQLYMQQALMEGAYSNGICAGLGASLGAAAMAPDGTASWEQKAAYKNILHKKLIDGELVHDPSTCSAYASSLSTLLGVTPAIAGAVYPLNQATYRFIYPEDNEIFGVSMNTNVGPTVLQAELAYRPDFPLATNASDQINQIADAAGVSAALTAFGHDTYALGSAAQSAAGATIPGLVDGVGGTGTFADLVKNVRRSSLPFISDTGGVNADYYSSAFINYDVISLDIGTTTSFSASHPVTSTLGADSAVLLTEVAMVQIQDLDNANKGFVSRGGFNEGAGEFLCLGVFQGLTGAQLAAVNTAITDSLGADYNIDYDLSTGAGGTNIGAGIVDAVFGNGSYCESQMGADERAFSYRVVGFATYNNFANSPWSVTPNFAWSSDPSGYGPSSLGGFTEGRSSLSIGVSAANGDVATSLSYVDQMGSDLDNLRNDEDYVSASVSYSF
jgi:hypothetical protein